MAGSVFMKHSLAGPVTDPYGGIGGMYTQACQGEYKNFIHDPCGGDSESIPYGKDVFT